MHPSSYENMQKCHARYFRREFAGRERVSIVDIGSASVNGSYRDIFRADNVAYCGVDLEAGDGVDIVLESPYRLPIDSASVDLVVSGQMLEHCEYFWQAFEEMLRVLKPDGMIFLIAPSAGPIHEYPVDCYRFYPDAYRALAKLGGCQLVDVWLDERGPWRDLVGVFSKIDRAGWTGQAIESGRVDQCVVDLAGVMPQGYQDRPEQDATRGTADYADVLRAAHEALAPGLYVEIGVRHGASLALARGKAIGVDPFPDIQHPLGPQATLFNTTSDEFFELHATQAFAGQPIDLAFIDGMHLLENVLKDFINIERHSSGRTIVLVDDVFPNHPAQAARKRATRVWTGDVWKIIPCLRRFRPDLTLHLLDTGPTGTLVVSGLDRTNRVLWDSYNPIVKLYRDSIGDEPTGDILERQGALPAAHADVKALFERLRETAGGSLP